MHSIEIQGMQETHQTARLASQPPAPPPPSDSLPRGPRHPPAAGLSPISSSLPQTPVPDLVCILQARGDHQVSNISFRLGLPSQDIDVSVAAGGGKPELDIKLAGNLQEDGHAGKAHL